MLLQDCSNHDMYVRLAHGKAEFSQRIKRRIIRELGLTNDDTRYAFPGPGYRPDKKANSGTGLDQSSEKSSRPDESVERRLPVPAPMSASRVRAMDVPHCLLVDTTYIPSLLEQSGPMRSGCTCLRAAQTEQQ
jgi:hypothetical protein